MRDWTAWIGAKYGTLTVEKYLGNQGTRNTFFLVRCDCGKTKKVITSDFLSSRKVCVALRIIVAEVEKG